MRPPSAIPFLPVSASSHATDMIWLFLGLILVSAAILALVFGLLVTFCVRYRRGSSADRSDRLQKTWRLETAWTLATFVLFLGLFFWGAELYIDMRRPPADATEIYVVAKQWMWKAEHEGGQREINTLHVPIGRPVRLVMTSQDVIHDFFVPAFRVKQDVLPGRLEELWFKPTAVGEYHLFCAEYCGTEHAHMGGSIVVMQPAAFAKWLETQGGGESLAQEGADLFRQYGCSGCHGAGSTVHAPPLEGLYGRPVPLSDGSIATADERYIRDSILRPKSQVAAGYPAIMPSFAGQIGEEDLMKLIAYVKSLGTAERPAR
jgi:cytochrome c oxidase subunit 2